MSPGAIAVVILVLLPAFIILGVGIAREEKRKRWEQRHAPAWWANPLPRNWVEQSVRPIEAPPPAEMAEVNDPRVIPITRAKRWPKVVKQGGAA